MVEGIEDTLKKIAQYADKDAKRLENLSKALVHIQALCGHPDPAEGCRNILKRAAEAQNELLQSYEDG